MDKKLVGGVFSNAENAEKAIRDLQDIGFTKNDISVFAKDDSQVDRIEDDTRTGVDSGDDSKGSKAGKGTGIGALSGGVLGGIVGLIAEVGLLAIPGIGPIAAAGPIATTLAGLGTGAVGGGIVGALVGAGMPEEEAKEYEKFLKSGKIIVMVEVTPDQQDQVYSTFRTHNTENAAMYR
jgi:uncharacterized membrane protein